MEEQLITVWSRCCLIGLGLLDRAGNLDILEPV